MRSIMETDVYTSAVKKFPVPEKITNLVTGKAGTILTMEDMDHHFTSLTRTFKDRIIMKALEDVKKGNLILVYCKNMTECLPPFMPFVKFASKGGEPKVLLDLSYMMVERDGTYNINQLETLYSLMAVAELTLREFAPKVSIPADVLDICAFMWAKMFCKVLNRTIALNINKERYEAFMYFAIQYFCRYIIDTAPAIANTVAEQFLKNGKSVIINEIEGMIAAKDLTPYNSFYDFCNVMFDNEITGVKSGLRGSKSSMNFVTYLSAFMYEYDRSSLFGLAAFPYFLLMIFKVNSGSRDINKRSLEEIMMNPKKFLVIIREFSKNL